MVKIYLSPSNQTRNYYNDGRTECDVCYETASILYDLINHDTSIDVQCILAQKDSPLSTRVWQSNNMGCDYHIPIHTNAGGGEGTRIFVHPKNKDNSFAKTLLKYVGEWSIGDVDKIVTNTSFYEITQTDAKCIYIEGEFHDTNGRHINPSDYANAIYDAIVEEFSKESTVNTRENPTESTNNDCEKLYRVQVGAYRKRENAEIMCRELKNKGMNAYINYS